MTASTVQPTDVVVELVTARRQLVTDGPPPGRAWCEAATEVVDRALCELAAPVLQAHPTLAVVAVGGYGRREVCPRSDVDLLLVHDRLEPPALEAAVRAIVYPLWDAGLTVGYAVRDRREAIAALDDVDTATATLELRRVCGDPGAVAALRAATTRRLRRRPARFLQALARADRQRRERTGDAAELLEPDLKDGAGGLRDVQSLRWAAAALVGTLGIDPLVPAGYLAAPDRRRLVRAYDRLLAARVALHLAVADRDEPGRQERLRLDLQDPVAARLGHRDGDAGAHDLAAHRLLTELTLAARTVDHVHRRAWTLIEADVARGHRRLRRPTERGHDGFELVDGVLRLPDGLDLDHPDLPVRLLAALADTGAVLDRRAASRLRTRVEDHLAADTVPWRLDGPRRAVFCEVLWRGGVALPAVAELDDVGLVGALLPEWQPLRGRPQRNPFHRFCLDRHAWHAAAALGDLVRREPWAADAAELVDDPDALLLGVLCHDVGKAHGEPHQSTGVPVATAIARRAGLDDAGVDLVARMVSLHLVLPDLARRRDVTDPTLAADVAEQVGDARTLAALHLLAAADGTATGPAAWTDWTASLVSTLVAKVAAVLDAAPDRDPAADRVAAAIRDEAVALAPELGVDPAVVADHTARIGERYLVAVTARAAVRHAAMAATRPAPTEVRTRVTPGALRPATAAEAAAGGHDPDGWVTAEVDELDVVAVDHPGWFAKVAGVLALHGGTILAADAFTRDDGTAVDTFKVQPPDGAGGSWWALVEGDLAEAAAGRLAIRARVARKARGDARRVARLPAVPTEVTTQPDPAGRATILEVRTLDRLGVLYAIATALAELQLDIVVARVQTLGFEVVDVFYVRDAEGQPLDRDHLTELELAVAAALDEHPG